MIEHVKESCKQLGIKNPPRLRIDYASSGFAGVIGNQFRSTLIISDDWYNKFHPETLKAIISHELGHIYYDHMSVKSFLKLFQMTSQELSTILDEFNNLINFLFGWLPFVGFLFTLVSSLFCLVGQACYFVFVYLVNFVSLVISRHQEYAADKFSYRAGFHEELLIFLHFLEKEEREPFFNFEEHPVTSKRKKRLLKYMAKRDEKYRGYDFDSLGENYHDLYPVDRAVSWSN
jgi:Zn-dependent protease with chaperone function